MLLSDCFLLLSMSVRVLAENSTLRLDNSIVFKKGTIYKMCEGLGNQQGIQTPPGLATVGIITSQSH